MKILVRGTNWIGDAVMSIGALRELRRLFPEAHIALHTRPWAEGIFRDARFLDELITFDDGDSEFRSMFRQAKMLRSRGFDLAVILPNSYRSAAIVKLARIPRRFGYSREGRRFLMTDPIGVPEWKDSRHEVFYYLEIVREVERRMLGTQTVDDSKAAVKLEVSDARVAAARDILKNHGIDGQRPLIAIGPGSANSRAKRWPSANFGRFIDHVGRELGSDIVLLGSKSEEIVGAAVSAAARTAPVSLIGKTDLADVTAILSLADAFVANDMGLAHIAAAVGTRTIVIFGPTNHETTRPFSPESVVVREPVECSPCMLRDCPIDHRCMTRIAPERVFTALCDLLGRAKAADVD